MSAAARRKSVTIPSHVHGEEHSLFFALLRRDGLPLPVTEYAFHPDRKWRMDYCWPEQRLFLEKDGGIWNAGRHTRGAGWLKDTDKLNAAAELGYRHLRCTPQQLTDLALIASIRRALAWSSLER